MEDLGQVLGLLGPLGGTAPDVLVGADEADDAAVVRVGQETLVLTADHFTPLVDDAYTWGRIAAANATSDVYAMGGTPLFALNIAGWPRDELPLELLADVLRGGREVADRAGMIIVGGHTIDDAEPKYGMCVLGRVDPERVLRLDAARPGDVLVLTKPIGTGIVTTAIKAETALPAAIEAAVASMVELNDVAAAAVVSAGAKACVDVTGFGLLGHLHRMLRASGVAAELDGSTVPLLPDARRLAEEGTVPGGTERNLGAVRRFLDADGVDETTLVLLADAQTSGGLLAALPEERAGSVTGATVGRIIAGDAGRVAIRGRAG